ncbi:MAG: cell division septal protein FtsQ, partial [Acidimicrobiales bacterium]
MNEIETENQELTKNERNEIKRKKTNAAHERKVKLLKMKRMAPWMIFLLLMVGGIYGSSILAQKSNASRPGEAV